MPRLARFTLTLLCLVILLTSPISTIPALASILTVTKTADTDDGTCDSDCSLREAIAVSGSGDTIIFDSSLSGGTIHLTSTLTLSRTLTIDGSSLASKITISGDSDSDGDGDVRPFTTSISPTVTLNSLIIAKGSATIEGGGLLLSSGTTATITNSTFSGNSALLGGGLSNYGTLTIGNSTFSGNSAPTGGGGVANSSVLTITNSTFSNNSSPGSGGVGGGLVNGGPTLIVNSTFSGNSAGQGGGIVGGYPLTIINSTISGNSAISGGGLYVTFPTNLINTIIANSTGGDCVNNGTIETNTNNLIEDGSCPSALSGDPNLGALADNGGPTQTFALLTGSSAIDAGDDTTCAASPVNNLDQRGVARPNGAHCDIGAYEYVDIAPSVTAFTATSPSTSLNIPITTFTASDDVTVTGYQITESSTPPSAGAAGWTASAPTTYTVASVGSHTLYPWAKDDAGHVSAVYGSPATVTVCLGTVVVTSTADSGVGTLRQAIDDACVGGSTITFDNALSGGTIYLTSTLTLTKDVTIDGSGLASKITLSGDSDNDGDGDVRVIHVVNDPLLNVALDSLILTKGQATGVGLNGEGGAILNEAYLTITNTTFLNNSSTGYGGAISNNRPLVITNSTFSGNSSTGADMGGGAIINANTLTISGSTFSNNTANASNGSGGAIFNAGSPATISNSTFSANSAAAAGAVLTTQNLTIKNSTFSGNSATIIGGLYVDGGTTNLENTIIANSVDLDSISPAECTNNTSGFGTNIKNLIEDGSCSPALSGDPNLGPLANNGGPTKTFALLAGSIAIDKGDDTTCAASPVNNLDQRGTTRPRGAHCEIGAYEYVDTTKPGVTSFSATSPSNSLNIPITAFTASDDVAVSGYKITESAAPPASGAAGWTGSAPTTFTVVGQGSHTLYPWAKDATGNVSAVYSSPVTVTVDSISPTVTMTSTALNPTKTSPITVTVTFSENVINFTVGDITASNAVISNFTGSGSSYTFRLTLKAPGLVTANIAAGVAQDSAGNLNTAATQFSRTYAPNIYLSFLKR